MINKNHLVRDFEKYYLNRKNIIMTSNIFLLLAKKKKKDM